MYYIAAAPAAECEVPALRMPAHVQMQQQQQQQQQQDSNRAVALLQRT
jgi:hypothetical protein